MKSFIIKLQDGNPWVHGGTIVLKLPDTLMK